MSVKTIEDRLNDLFDELVPASGKADTLAGEIVRAICRIGYRNYNDGDHLGVGYGRWTCNPAGRFLAKKCDDAVAHCVWEAWSIRDDDAYEEALDDLEIAVLNYLDANPELKTTPNDEDMFDYRDPYEDTDDYDDDDEDCD